MQDTHTSLSDQQVKNAFVHGFIEINEAGDSEAVVAFPVMFVEEPNFSHGLILEPNQTLTAGQFPLYGALILEWVTKDQGDHHRIWWTGARIAIAIDAPQGVRFKLSYTFAAQAFRAPTDDNTTAGSTL